MPCAEFIDTNFWVYAHLEDPHDPKCAVAWQLLDDLAAPYVSAQMIAEYFNVIRREGREDNWSTANIELMLQQCRVQPLDRKVVHGALVIRRRYRFSYWDCQILAAALQASCNLLYTEDLQHGQTIEGIRVVNPFVSGAEAHGQPG